MSGERDCPFVSSSSDSEVANGSTEELDIGVAGAGPVKKVRVWSSFIDGSEGESDDSDVENTASVSESSSEKDSEYFSHKKYHHSKYGVHNWYVNCAVKKKWNRVLIGQSGPISSLFHFFHC